MQCRAYRFRRHYISEQGKGSPFTPGIYNQIQIEAWQKVTGEVHQAGGKIFAQLWHTWRAGHPLNKNGQMSAAPSAIAIKDQKVFTPAAGKRYKPAVPYNCIRF